MGWGKVQQKRLQVEGQLLAHFFPGFHWKHPSDPQKTAVEGEVRTNSKRVYVIRLYVPANFPNSRPEVVIVSPDSLKGYKGQDLPTFSGAMHTLGIRDGHIQLCLYGSWVPNITLYAALLKARLWLEAFEAYQQTGQAVDHFLRHA
jgi:hypothetical protein